MRIFISAENDDPNNKWILIKVDIQDAAISWTDITFSLAPHFNLYRIFELTKTTKPNNVYNPAYFYC